MDHSHIIPFVVSNCVGMFKLLQMLNVSCFDIIHFNMTINVIYALDKGDFKITFPQIILHPIKCLLIHYTETLIQHFIT